MAIDPFTGIHYNKISIKNDSKNKNLKLNEKTTIPSRKNIKSF